MTSEISFIILIVVAIFVSTSLFIKSFDLVEERPNYFIALAAMCYYFTLAGFIIIGIYSFVND
jgi:hypothetical protein